MNQQMQTFVNTLDKWFNAEDIALNIEGCLGCNQCGQACAWYLETGDERMHPKVRADFIRDVWHAYTPLGRLKTVLGFQQAPTVEDLRGHMDQYFKCTLCGRCTLACPVGISNRRIFRAARAAYMESGLSLENPTIKAIVDNTRDKRHSFGLSRKDVFIRPALLLDYEGVEVPVDVKGAEHLFVCPAAGNTKIPELGINLIKILNVAGVDYTVSSDVTDTGTEVDHIAVHHELSRQLLLEWEAVAEKLGVKDVVVAECGCDERTMYFDAEETLGRPFKFPVISIDTIIHECINNGKLPVKKIDQSVTFHDPCYVVRLSGLGDKYREMLNVLVKDFREMTPNKEQNYCCNCGAGGMRLPEQTDLRRKVSRLKAKQIEDTGAELVTTPCAVCYLGMKDTTEYYKQATPQKRKARMFFEIVYDAMMKALESRGETDRVRTPAVLTRLGDQARVCSLSSMLNEMKHDPELPAMLEKLRKDPNINNYAYEHPDFWKYFDSVVHEITMPKTINTHPVTDGLTGSIRPHMTRVADSNRSVSKMVN
ncbi:MAG: (Fe-S)-binding protein [Pseudomonadota bacterium]